MSSRTLLGFTCNYKVDSPRNWLKRVSYCQFLFLSFLPVNLYYGLSVDNNWDKLWYKYLNKLCVQINFNCMNFVELFVYFVCWFFVGFNASLNLLLDISWWPVHLPGYQTSLPTILSKRLTASSLESEVSDKWPSDASSEINYH